MNGVYFITGIAVTGLFIWLVKHFFFDLPSVARELQRKLDDEQNEKAFLAEYVKTIRDTMRETPSARSSYRASLQEELKSLRVDVEKQQHKMEKMFNDQASFAKSVQGLREMLSDLMVTSPEHGETVYDNLFILREEIEEVLKRYRPKECDQLKKRIEFLESSQNLRAIPYMAAIMADYETYGIENLAACLDWGSDQKRLKKVKDIREIRRDAQEIVARHKEAEYQLAYLLELFPGLNDYIEAEYEQLPIVDVNELSEYDRTRDYLSKEEYSQLSVTERNQLALDRYVQSHNKTKWQIGRDYELYVGYCYEKKGFHVDYFGAFMGLEDLGRDLIIKKDDGTVLIIQCKYWSSLKQIHEKHITQLYGTVACYCVENNYLSEMVKGILITNIALSDTAKKMADYLGISYKENFDMGEFPRIKCNIGRDEYGCQTKIYHLPFDQQYDSVKIDKPGEFLAFSADEAERRGFRRAYRWHEQG